MLRIVLMIKVALLLTVQKLFTLLVESSRDSPDSLVGNKTFDMKHIVDTN